MPTHSILLVEDDMVVRQTLHEILVDEGFNVVVAADGREGLSALERAIPDLVISDIRMPYVDGFELLAAVRKRSPLCPVIFISAKAEDGDIRMGMSLGADDYLVKPFDPVQLIDTLRSRLERAGRVQAQIAEKEYFLMDYLPHELRTPLTGILGYSELMVVTAREGTGLSPAETEQFGEGIHKSGLRLLGLVDNFCLWMELSQRSNKSLQDRGGWRLEHWVERLRNEMLRVTDRYSRSGDLELALEPASLKLPDNYLPRVVAEVVDNAFKYSMPGSKVLLTGSPVGDRYVFRIEDRGRGMSDEAIASIGLFRQFDRTHWEQQGLGLGLAIVQRFAEIANGSLQISRPVNATGLVVELSVPRSIQPPVGGPCG